MSVLYKQHHGVVPQRRDNVCTYNVRHYLRGSALNKSAQLHHRPQAAEQKWTAEFIKNKTFGEAPGHTLARRVRARGRRLRDPDKCICQCYSRRATGGSAWYPLAHARLSPTPRIKTRGGWISQRGRARARANNLKESARAVLIAHEINLVERRGRGTLRCGARSHRPDSCPEVGFCSTNIQMWGSKHPNR